MTHQSLWSPDVVGVPQPNGLELWKTSSGARLQLSSVHSGRLPELGELSKEAVAKLRRAGFLVGSESTNECTDLVREGILGLPAISLAGALRGSPRPDILVLGAAADVGTASNPGARHGPEVLRRFSSRHLSTLDAQGRLTGLFDPTKGPSPLQGKAIFDIGDLFPVPSDPREQRSKIYSAIQTTVRSIACNGVRPLLLGGDHSVTAPSYMGVRERHDAMLVVFDAHLDAEEAGITDFDQLTHANFLSGILELFPAADVCVLGVREPVGAHLWPLPDRIRCYGVPTGIDYLRSLPQTDVYLSIDLDVLDPAFFPATGHPSPGGLTVRELAEAIGSIGEHHRIVASDVVEAMHSREHDYTTGQVGSYVVRCLLEAMARMVAAQ